jgi:hypothetical protein
MQKRNKRRYEIRLSTEAQLEAITAAITAVLSNPQEPSFPLESPFPVPKSKSKPTPKTSKPSKLSPMFK